MKFAKRVARRGVASAPIAILLCIALADVSHSASFAEAQADVDQRLRKSLSALASERDRITKERIPLSRTVSKLESEVLELRREHARLLEVRDSRTIDLSSLQREVDSLENQEEFVNSRLNEFVRDFEGRLDVSELGRYQELTAAAKLADKNANLDTEGRRVTQLRVVTAALGRLREQLGGESYAGEALSPEGLLTAGTFVALGPTVFFASEDGSVNGLVETQLNAADPVVVPLPGDLGAGILQIARHGAGRLPLDATLGKALKKAKASRTLFDYVQAGGAVGYVIVVLGAATLALTVFKSREILGFPVADPSEVDSVLDELSKGNHEAAHWQAQRLDGIAGEMLTTGVEHVSEKRGVLEELLFEKILAARPSLERFLPFIAITAAAAPLLGLLGTVIGMIKTFQLITIFGTGDAKSLSSGISEALVTTALGLIVAIPALVLHGALSRMAKRKLGSLEQLSVGFVNGVAAIRHRPQETGYEGFPSERSG